ncbi:MAG: hypothetical protein BMS9Abin23_1106 [Thermodesulfobacteriota bacterium]|nr:MAG: hypothetical protein BMS9Abin23_1106 [Thermodesulfobacteriota bacterium]
MGNSDTVRAITDNIKAVLKSLGIHLSPDIYRDDKNVPASLMPYGHIFYEGEDFEYTNGQRPGYAECSFTIKVLLKERDPSAMVREQQRWVHDIRGALTVNALNAGTLAVTGYVTRVTTRGVDVENSMYLSRLVYSLSVRYRES